MCYEYEWYEKARLAEQARRLKDKVKEDRRSADPQVPVKTTAPARPVKEHVPA
jgi:hypothetical protein